MIQLQNMSKFYSTKRGKRLIFNDLNLEITRGQKIGIFGKNGSGKSTLLRIIAGVEQPNKGRIMRKMSISWPITIHDFFNNKLTGFDCIRFIARLYGLKANKELIDFIITFSELQEHLYKLIGTYSSGMRVRLNFALAVALEFDCYLIDEAIAVSDDIFRQKCYDELFEKRKDRTYVIVSHDPDNIIKLCQNGAVLENKQLNYFHCVNEAFQHYYAG